MIDETPTHPAAGCSITARATFEAIALGQDKGHPQSAIGELLAEGLIVRDYGGGWSVHAADHLAFCEWCATQEPL